MASLHHLLILLTFARLLAPPGLCLCAAGTPAVDSVTQLLGQEVPPPASEPIEDHDPGCPASGLSEAMGLQPATFAFHLQAVLLAPVDPAPTPAIALLTDVSAVVSTPPDDDRYLTLCALLL